MKFIQSLLSRTSFLVFGFFLALGITLVLAAWTPVKKAPLDPLLYSEWNTVSYNASAWQRSGTIDLPSQNIFTNLSGGVGIGNTVLSGGLKLDVEGAIGATQYCDKNGENCILAADLANGGGLNGIICQNGQILQYNGTSWVCASSGGSGGGDSLWTSINGGVALPVGVVAIGTDTPDAELHIMPNTVLTSDLDADIRLGDDQGWALSGMNTTTGGDSRRFSLQDATGEKLVVNHNGNVGIGTDAPNAALDIVNLSTTTATSHGLSVRGGGDTDEAQGANTGYEFRTMDLTGNIDFFIRGDGKVGIGTDIPTSSLQVVGIVEYADNATALGAGLTPGALYRTGDVLKIVH